MTTTGLKIAVKALWVIWFIATCLGHVGFTEQWLLIGIYFFAISVPISLWFLKADATDGHLVTR